MPVRYCPRAQAHLFLVTVGSGALCQQTLHLLHRGIAKLRLTAGQAGIHGGEQLRVKFCLMCHRASTRLLDGRAVVGAVRPSALWHLLFFGAKTEEK